MSTALQLTTDEFDRMVEKGSFDHLVGKIELIRGELRRINPAGPVHDDCISYLLAWSVRSTDPALIQVTVQTALRLEEMRSRPEPDLMWVRAARYRRQHPTPSDVKLAIEVADSSLQADLVEKSELYAESGICEYWVVDTRGQCVHVYRNPRAGVYEDRSIVKPGEPLLPLAPCAVPLDLHDLFVAE